MNSWYISDSKFLAVFIRRKFWLANTEGEYVGLFLPVR